jgi:ribonuclease HII
VSGIRANNSQLISFDKAKANGFRFLFGVDEAGRGPLAGPVVAAAVCIRDMDFLNRIGDSKKLSLPQREKAFREIRSHAVTGVGIMSETVIDQVNILGATHLAMAAAVKDLVQGMIRPLPGEVKVLIDGNSFEGDIPWTVETVVKGDALSLAIGAASIIAKVTRDRIMLEYDRLYPQYGFAIHKGYPTAAHRAAIKVHGLSPIHRKTFRSN